MVPALARIAVASGADGLLVEVHPNPAKALSDGEQSLDFAGFDAMMADLEPWIRLQARQTSGSGLQEMEAANLRCLEALG